MSAKALIGGLNTTGSVYRVTYDNDSSTSQTGTPVSGSSTSRTRRLRPSPASSTRLTSPRTSRSTATSRTSPSAEEVEALARRWHGGSRSGYGSSSRRTATSVSRADPPKALPSLSASRGRRGVVPRPARARTCPGSSTFRTPLWPPWPCAVDSANSWNSRSRTSRVPPGRGFARVVGCGAYPPD